MNKIIEPIWKSFLKYQDDNNIVDMSMVNVIFWIDYYNNVIVKKYGGDKLKFKAGIVIYNDEKTQESIVRIHTWCVSSDGSIIDPTFEIANIPYEKLYCGLKEAFELLAKHTDDVDIRIDLANHICNIHRNIQIILDDITEMKNVEMKEYYDDLINHLNINKNI